MNFPQMTFTQSATFSADFQVHFITDVAAFGAKYGQFWREELEVDGLLRVRLADLDPAAEQASPAKILFVVDKQNLDAEEYETLLGKVFRKLKALKVASFDFGLPSKADPLKLGYYCETMNYYYELKNKLGKEGFFRIESVNFVTDRELVTTEDFKFYHTIGIYKSLARDFANGRTNLVGIETFLKDARTRFESLKDSKQLTLTIIQGEDLLKQRLNLIHAVGKGSCQSPALLNLSYNGNPASDRFFSLIGKGVVFDQGGMDYKGAGIENMYTDKAGACSMYGAFWAAVHLGLKTNLTCSIALVENTISGSAYRPSDIITSHAGLTVQVTNTDAEGRLVLADAMSWTQDNYKLSHMIEFSTLTGAMSVALKDLAGVFSNCADFAATLASIGDIHSDRMHVMPMTAECDEMMDSKLSDVRNYPMSGSGGAISAACFLRRFVKAEGIKWAHIDVAPVMLWPEPRGLFTDGTCTGFGVASVILALKNAA